jgi:DNA-binding MarR family transcriptional regulator
MPLAREIKKTKPFDSLEQEVFLNLQRTADALMRGVADLLKPAGLSPTQYNVLRILRGVIDEPDSDGSLACQEIGQRMITRDPDITRLLDRLESRGWIARQRSKSDRRVIEARITAEGLKLLKSLDHPIRELHLRQLAHLGRTRLKGMSELLETARRSPDAGQMSVTTE